VLVEQIRQQEAKTLRVQQRLEQLEARLGNPEHSATVVAYYQLRAIWDLCHSRLTSFSAELERAQYDKKRRQHVADFKRKINDSLTGVQAQLKEATDTGEELSAKVRALREKRSMRKGFWSFFQRRKLTAQMQSIRQERRSIRIHVGKLTEEIQSRTNQEPPEFDGLSVQEKRGINLTLIAYAQELYLHFSDRDLASRVREASLRQLVDAHYGSVRDCRNISKQVESRMKSLADDGDIQARVQVRATFLSGNNLEHRQNTDTVPMAGGLGGITVLKADGTPKNEVAINILADEYWDVFTVLLV
jgi:hypothetical protein